MHRFKIAKNEIVNARAPLSNEEAAHALKVLRLKDGEAVQALDGEGGMWSAKLCVTDGKNAYLELESEISNSEAPIDVTVYMGIPKGDKFEFLCQKLTELGVRRLVPVRMERSVAKIEEKEKDKKLQRFRKIAQEAQKQCGRGMEMEISDPISVKELEKRVNEHVLTLLLWEEAEGYRTRDAYRDHPAYTDIACIIGPEGGISEKEAGLFMDAGAKCVTLGPRILRAETAAVTSVSVIMSLWGDV